ncbi:MAG: hypothetical protein ACYTJ0_19720 [Planctomycetota bacterium]|jgi:predicted negative regulator of RcsB-dependent stress response
MDQDRERLKEVHATDLTESRGNEEFVDWLKNKGPTYLLVILVAVTAYLAVVRWKMHKQQQVDDAWIALREAALPNSKLDVADQHESQFAVPQLALNAAGTQLLRAIQAGQTVESLGKTNTDGTPMAPTAEDALSDEERSTYLDRAYQAFGRVLEYDDGSLDMTLHAVRALEGRAAIAEARGDAEAARSLYDEAAARAQTYYPSLPGDANQNPAIRPFTAPYSPATIEPALQELLMPDAAGG